MKKIIIIGISSLLIIVAGILVFINKDALFGHKKNPSPQPKRVLTDKEKAVKILSKKLGIDESKFVYVGTNDKGELLYTSSDKKTTYTINVETEIYTVEQDLIIGSAKKK